MKGPAEAGHYEPHQIVRGSDLLRSTVVGSGVSQTIPI